MRRFSITHFILFGVLAWGLPGVIVAGPIAVLLALTTALPLAWLLWRNRHATRLAPVRLPTAKTSMLAVGFAILYLAFDALFGREKFAYNLFLFSGATDAFIDNVNKTVSQGRGGVELLGALLIFLPFALLDTAGQARRSLKPMLWSIGLLLIFYEVGISRGFVLMAVMAIVLGQTVSLLRLSMAVGFALLAFTIASESRGDFAEMSFSNPLFDGIVWPYINLSMLLETRCGNGTWYSFLLEFLKKFVPSSIVPKEIFSFNIEMTRCIYPFFGDAVGSISIFTYLGELFYYGPSVLTALIAGGLMALLAVVVDRQLLQYQLLSTRIFTGLLCIVLLRSRVLDVLSFLLFLWLFMLFWRALSGTGGMRSYPPVKTHFHLEPSGRSATTRTDSSLNL
jgi:hypothetical protein